MTEAALRSLFDNFSKKKILVAGDIMLDAYIYGQVDRISPEAPVPVVSVNQEDTRPGGAANVALNLKSLGAQPILLSISGKDSAATEFNTMMDTYGISTAGILQSEGRLTTKKTRVIGNQHQMLRVDHEMTKDISSAEEKQLLALAEKLLDGVDAVIFEDYNKGLLTETLIAGIIDLANKKNIPTIVDPKKKNFFAYKGCTLFKPNLKEIREGLKTDKALSEKEEWQWAGNALKEILQHKISFITLSEKGVFITDHDQQQSHIPAHIRNIADVSGAGDTVVSVAALCLACGTDLYTLAALSNIAGGLVCEEIGVVPVNKDKLLQEALRLMH